MGDDAHGPSLDGRIRALEDIIDGLDAEQRRTRERLADVARLAEIVMQAPGDPRAAPRHAKPKRDRHGLRVIPGGLAALVPLAMPGHGGAGLAPAAGHLWLSARNWPRWAVAALALGLAGATAMPAAADIPDPPAHHAPGLIRPVLSEVPDRGDGDRDDRAHVARLHAGPAGGTIGP
jgi:hypothetical protein